jgi:uncharacterized protein (DUF1778 family)
MKTKKVTREGRLYMRLSQEDERLLKTLSEELGMSVSDFVRFATRNTKDFLDINSRLGRLIDEAHDHVRALTQLVQDILSTLPPDHKDERIHAAFKMFFTLMEERDGKGAAVVVQTHGKKL